MRIPIIFALLLSTVLGWELTITPRGERLANRRTGDNLLVLCKVNGHEGAASDVSVDWYRNGILVSRMGSVMTIRNPYSNQLLLNRPKISDSGVYVCKAKVDGAEEELEADVTFIDPPKFVDSEVEQHPEEGTTAQIKCKVEGSEYNVFWQFNGANIGESSPRGYDFEDEKQTLIIPQYNSKKDDGVYSCNAAQFSSYETLLINVTGFSRPVITVFDAPLDGRGFEGQSAQLKCGAIGKPKPQYKWFDENDHEMVSSDKYTVDGGLLVIESLASDDAGKYRCAATNAIGDDNKTAELEIFLKPRIEHMVDITKKAEEDIEIVCRYTGEGDVKAKFVFGEQEFSVEDVKENSEEEEVSKTTPENVDPVESEELEEQDGTTDMASNQHYDETESTLPTQSEELDEDSTDAEEMEENSRWRRFVDDVSSERVSVRAEGNSLILSIHHLSLEDAGQYRCLVENEAGVREKSTNVAITHPPTLIASSDAIVRSFDGNKLTIFCDVSAVPEPSWTWTRNGDKVEADGTSVVVDTSGTSSRLIFETASGQNYGNYKCEADNGIGKTDKSMDVIEITPPSVPYGLDCKQLLYPNYGKCTVPEGTYNDEATKPTHFEFLVAPIDDIDLEFDWDHARVVKVDYDGIGMSIPHLSPSTQYQVRARAINEAGLSEMTEAVSMETTEPWAPNEPEHLEMECDDTCTITWSEPNDHGSEISAYRISVQEMDQDEYGENQPIGNEFLVDVGSDESSLELSHIRPNSVYRISVLAVNAIGKGSSRTIEVETDDKPTSQSEGISTAKLLLAVLAGLMFLLFIVDLICFSVNRCGLIACFCLNCLGRNPSERKDKDLEAGRNENGRLLDNQPASAR